MDVAKTILHQLGGNRFLAMTGAKQLVGGPDFLQMTLPRGLAANKATRCTVKLNAFDTYDVHFGKWNGRALELVEISTCAGVYAEDLRRIFTAETGLDCTL